MNNASQTPSTPLEGSAPGAPASSFPDEDAALLERTRHGDAAAFETLFVKYRQRLFAVAWRLLHDEDKALDVVQEAFVKAYEQIDKLRGETRFFPWLRRIAINVSIDQLRHQRRGVEVELDEQRIGQSAEDREEPGAIIVGKRGEDSPLEKAERAEFNAAFAAAVQKLSEAHRTVFMLHAAEGLSYKEIAEALHCNIGTVMSRLFYARKRLQELLAPHLR